MENKEIIIKDALLPFTLPKQKEITRQMEKCFYILMEKMQQDFLQKFLIKILL